MTVFSYSYRLGSETFEDKGIVVEGNKIDTVKKAYNYVANSNPDRKFITITKFSYHPDK